MAYLHQQMSVDTCSLKQKVGNNLLEIDQVSRYRRCEKKWNKQF